MKRSTRTTLWLVVLVLISTFTHSSLAAAEEKEEVRKTSSGPLEEFLNIPFKTAQELDKALGGKIFNLGEIKVSGNRIASAAYDEVATDIPHNVTVVGEKEMKESGVVSLPQVLGQKEGVTYSDELGQGLNARVDLRGFGGEAKQALVLFDGVRAVEPFDNSVAWHLYPKEYLEQIEIQRGGATIYGEGAFSGVIRLKTKKPTDKLTVSSENSWGDFGTEKYFAEVSDTVSGFGFYAGARYTDTQGYRQNSDHESASTLVKGEFHVSDLVTVEESFYFADNETGIAGPLSGAEVSQNRRQKDPDGQFGDQFQDKLVQNELTLRVWIEPLGIELSNLSGYRLRDQDSIQTFGGSFPGTSINEIGTETFSDVLQATWNLEGDFYKSRFTGGAEWSKDDIHNPFTFLDFTFGPFSSERSIDRRMVGLFLQEHVTLWERLIVEAGVRWDKVDWDIYDLKSPQLEKHKKAENLSPTAGVEFKFYDALSVYGSYSEAFKVPDSNTLIFETPNIFSPNPNIDPQLARHTEVGLRYAHPVFGSVRADYFYIETKKEILFNDITNLNENFDTQRQGFEVADEIALTRELQVTSNYTYTRAKFDGGLFHSRDIPLVPTHKWSAGFVWDVLKNLSISVQATGVYDQFVLNDFNNRFPSENYWVLGGRISYHRDHWEIYARGENVLDEEYSSFVTSDGVSTINFNPAPTSYFEVGFKIKT